MNLGNDKGRRSRGDGVDDTGNSKVSVRDGSVNGAYNGSDGDHSHGASCLGGRKSCGSEEASSAAHLDDSSHAGETQSQSEFIRQQRMKWLESTVHTTTKRSDSQPTEKSGERSEKKLNPTVSTAHRPNKTATTSEVNSSVVTSHSNTTVLHRKTDSITGGQRPDTKAATNHVGTETEHSSEENDENCIDEKSVRNCQNSQTGSGSINATVFGTKKDDSKKETEATVKESPVLDNQPSRCTTASDAGISEHHRTECDSDLQQQPMLVDLATATSELVSDDRPNHCLETGPKAATVEVQKVETVSASIFSEPPLSGSRALLSTENDSNVVSSHRSEETPETSDSVVRETEDTVTFGSHDAFEHIKHFDRTDSGSASRSNEVLNSSCTTSLYLDEPLIEDEFDVYVKTDGLELWSPGRSTSESMSAQLQHVSPSAEPSESIADTDDTLFKLPVISASEVASDKSCEETNLSEETRTDCPNTCELAHSMTSNRPNVENDASSLRTLWRTCVYSRNDVAVDEVSTRVSPANRDNCSMQSSVVGDAETTALVDGISGKNEVAHFQTSNSRSVSPVCRPRNDQDAVTNDGKQSISQQIVATSQEFLGCTSARMKCNSANDSTEAKFDENVCEKSSDDVPLCSVVRKSVCQEPRDTIDSLNALAAGETDKHSDADDTGRLTDTYYEIPAEMEADFVEQMHQETCPNVLRSSMEDFSSEISLDVVVTHVVDARHFWGQIVNEGIQVIYQLSV